MGELWDVYPEAGDESWVEAQRLAHAERFIFSSGWERDGDVYKKPYVDSSPSHRPENQLYVRDVSMYVMLVLLEQK